MNIRWPLVASVVALFGGIALASLVLALCSEGAEGPGELEVRATAAAATRTAIARSRTPATGTLAAERTPEQSTPVPATETPASQATATPVAPTQTASPTPVLPPDLLVRDLGVFRDQILVVVSNVGGGPLPAGSQVDIGVRGIVADSVVVGEPLLPGDSFTLVLADQVIYMAEVVLGVVDPNGVIPEENEENNTLTKSLEPDVTPDLGLAGLDAVGEERLLAVDIENTTEVPIRQAEVTLEAFRCDSSNPLSTMDTTIDLDPVATIRILINPQVSVGRRVCMQVTMEVLNIPDSNPDNDEYEGRVS